MDVDFSCLFKCYLLEDGQHIGGLLEPCLNGSACLASQTLLHGSDSGKCPIRRSLHGGNFTQEPVP